MKYWMSCGLSLLLLLGTVRGACAEPVPAEVLREGNRLMARGDYDGAVNAYRHVIARNHNPDRVAAARRWMANAQLKKAEELLRRGQPAAALVLLDQLHAQSPPSDLARLAEQRRAEVLMKLKRPHDAMMALSRLHAPDTEDQEIKSWPLPVEVDVRFGPPQSFLGLRLEIREGKLIVAEILKDSPADKAGLRAGDVIVAIDGKKSFALDGVRRALDGTPKTKVKIEIQRPGHTGMQTIEIERSLPPAPGGIGVQIEVQEDRPVILRVARDSPAARGGLRTGDVIVAINGKSTGRMDIREIVTSIRGAAGSKVVLGMRRGDDKTFVVELTRAPLPRPEPYSEIEQYFRNFQLQPPRTRGELRPPGPFGPELPDSI